MLPMSPSPPMSPASFMSPPGTSPDLSLPIDPSVIIQMLIGEEPETFKPKYPPHYDKKDWPKPKPQQIWTEYRREERRHSKLIERQLDTIARLRFDVSGIFPRDIPFREAGDQDKFLATDLVDDWQLLSSILASFDMNATKRVLNRNTRLEAQTLEDFARICREEEMYRWARTGDMPLPLAEAKVLTSYGRIASRHLCDLEDPEYPFIDELVDPMSLFPVGGGIKGLRKVYRGMRMTMARAMSEWGEPTKENRAKLHNKYGKDDETAIITICEYADQRWRAALTEDGCEFLPITEHRYGYVPFVIQGGPGGEPLFTDTAQAGRADFARTGPDGILYQTGSHEDWGLEHKMVSSIHLQRERHDQLEAVMSRIVTAIADANDPAMVLTRDHLTGGTPLPKFDRRRGRVNEIGMGETLQEMPIRNPPMDIQNFVQIAQQDKMTGSIPLGMYGQQTGSQQTGNSMSVASEAGMDHITPWVMALEHYHTRKQEMRNMNWRNMGHLTRFKDGDEQPFMIPVAHPSNNQELARELTPQLIDRIGPRVNITLSRVRLQEMMQLVQIAQGALPMGLSTVRRMAERMGEPDFDRMREEWMDEQNYLMLRQDEQARRMIEIPKYAMEQAEAATDPKEHALWMALLDFWMQQQMMQMQQQMMPQQPAAPGAPQGGGLPMLPGGGMPGSNTMNFAANPATAPGAMGGPVGRPPGPMGPVM
jgi:hypothetical protein